MGDFGSEKPRVKENGDGEQGISRENIEARLPVRTVTESEETKTLLRATWALAWPVVLEQALSMVSQVVDMAMVGRLGAESVAAIGLSMQPFFLINAVFMGLSVGTTSLCARATGAKNREEAGKVAGQSIVVAFIFGVIVSYLGFLKSDWIIAFMKAEIPVRALGASYVKAMMPGMLLFFVFTVSTAALRGAGDTTTPMLVNLGINVIHVFTNYLLIFGYLGFPALGVTGAGISTSISRILGGAAMLYVLSRPRGKLTVDWKKTVREFDWALFRRILNIGVPAAMERVLTSTGQIAYARQVAGLGTQAYAAHSLSLNVESFSYMPGMGFATAATSLVGQRLGAKDPSGAEKSAIIATKMAVMTMGSMGLMFFLFPGQFLRIFTDDPDIIARGVPLLRIVAFTQIPEAIGFVIPGALRGAGDTRIAMYVTVAGVWVVRLGLTYLLMEVFGLGLAAAWIAMFSDWVVRSSLYWIRLKRGKWKEIKV
ncbi:MAG: MATE family efflux transporter [Candidatus Fermentithermobacillus carboniphilus]|uniref:Probable multidrug resistance protein NorM n=1 Tax=Candidatus Fermentithermobacillus carboniphilus TaxID=3085328 RepID=A0AAT9LAG6_9FIRM|nr:MAG: MATE family efflux transporter [Candidatus Fermentithermobacillus carboniphilus]